MADTTDMAAEPVRSRGEETVAGTEATPPTTLDLAWLYRLHADRSRRLAYLLTGDLQLAEDVVQEAFIRVGARLGRLRSSEAFPAYLQRTVVNLSHAAHRTRARERQRIERARDWTHPAEMEPPVVEPELWNALQTLPERQRAAIVLRFWLDLSEERMADVLRCRPGTVKSLLSRGLAAMRERVSRV